MKAKAKTEPYRLPPLFFLPSLEPAMTEAEIIGEEANHALRARRLRVGDYIDLTNGRGLMASAEITSIRSRPDTLVVSIRNQVEFAATKPTLVLASALPKGERLATMLDMATQLGVDQVVPLQCDYSVVQYQPKMRDRWARIITSACKQSRRAWKPDIGQSITPGQLVESAPADSLIVYGDHKVSNQVEPAGIPQSVQQIMIMIGPEAGFSSQELVQLEKSPRTHGVSISHHILRTETAAVAMLSYSNILRLQIAGASVPFPGK